MKTRIFNTGETRKRIRVVVKKDGKVIKDKTTMVDLSEIMKFSLDIDVFFEKGSTYGELGTYKIILEEIKHEKDSRVGVWFPGFQEGVA